MATYKLVWDDFCAWYLEAMKPEFVDGRALPMDQQTYNATINFFEQLLKIMHPWMPFITEELWHLVKYRGENDCCIIAKWPEVKQTDEIVLKEFEVVKELIAQIRGIRQQKQISPKEKLQMFEKSEGVRTTFDEVVVKLANLTSFNYTTTKIENAFSFQIYSTEFFVPLESKVNRVEEIARLKKDLDYNLGFLKAVQTKLANEKFVANAKPELIAMERKKESDALSKISSIEEQLKNL